MTKFDPIKVYWIPGRAVLGILAGLALILIFIWLIFNIQEGVRPSLFGRRVIPNFILNTAKFFGIMSIVYIALQLRQRFFDLFQNVPLLEIREDVLILRSLIKVHKVDWADINDAKFVSRKEMLYLYLKYTTEKGHRKSFMCNVSLLTVDEKKIVDVLSSKLKIQVPQN